MVYWDREVDNVKQFIFMEIIAYTRGAQHVYVVSKFPTLEKEIIVLLKAH